MLFLGAFVAGLWAAHQYCGNIIGIGYVNLVEHNGWNVSLCFILPAAQAFIAANLVLLFVTTNPMPIRLEEERSNLAEDILKNGGDFSVNGVSNERLLGVEEEQREDIGNQNDIVEKEEYEYGVESDRFGCTCIIYITCML